MWVFCGGMRRAGSTLQFQIVAHIVEMAQLGVRVPFVPPKEFPRLQVKHAKQTRYKVFKTHCCSDAVASELEEGNALGFYSYRDIRDVIVSSAYKSGTTVDCLLERPLVDELIEQHRLWTGQPRVLVCRYEDMMVDLPTEVARIANHLEVNLSTGESEQIAGLYGLEKQKVRISALVEQLEQEGRQDGFDQTSLLHANHIRSGRVGQWRQELSSKQLSEIESRYGGWLEQHGYVLSTGFWSGKGPRFYSQHGEDFLLWNFFKGAPEGFFLDIGAFDGIHLSNSYVFEQAGWKGICVEPHPQYYPLCKASRPGSICVNAACVGNPEISEIKFYIEKLGLLSGMSERTEDVRKRYESRWLDFEGFNEITVRATTINKLLEEHLPSGTSVDFISIDVEGAELEVLRGIEIKRFTPRVICLEANDEDMKRELDDCLKLAEYQWCRTLGPNRFYVRDDLDAERMRAIRLDCVIEQNLHPLGAHYTPKAARLPRKLIERELYKQELPEGVVDRFSRRFRQFLGR